MSGPDQFFLYFGRPGLERYSPDATSFAERLRLRRASHCLSPAQQDLIDETTIGMTQHV
jgi:hypothetical protein